MKPRFVIAMLLVFTLAVPAPMLAQQNTKAEKDIRAVMAELEQANLKGGTEALAIFEKFIADEYTRIPPNGTVLTRAEIFDGWRTGKIKVAALENSDIKICVYGHTAIVTGIETSKAAMMGANYLGQTRLMRIFVKRDGRWQCVLFQSTRIAEPAKQ